MAAIIILNLSALARCWFIQLCPYHNDSVEFPANKMLKRTVYTILIISLTSDTLIYFLFPWQCWLVPLGYWCKITMSLWKSLVMVNNANCLVLFHISSDWQECVFRLGFECRFVICQACCHWFSNKIIFAWLRSNHLCFKSCDWLKSSNVSPLIGWRGSDGVIWVCLHSVASP